jgi:hypothetical protein
MAVALSGVGAIARGLRARQPLLAFSGSSAFIAGLLGGHGRHDFSRHAFAASAIPRFRITAYAGRQRRCTDSGRPLAGGLWDSRSRFSISSWSFDCTAARRLRRVKAEGY